MNYNDSMFFMIFIATFACLLTGAGLAFGPLKVDPAKLKPHQTPEMAIKKTRKSGYIILFISIIMLAGSFFFFLIL